MRTSQLSLMNKITETYAIAEDQEPPEQGRAALGELEKRLNLIKPQ
jgi:ATP-dependent Clp protease protease subunit